MVLYNRYWFFMITFSLFKSPLSFLGSDYNMQMSHQVAGADQLTSDRLHVLFFKSNVYSPEKTNMSWTQ